MTASRRTAQGTLPSMANSRMAMISHHHAQDGGTQYLLRVGIHDGF